MFSDSFKISHQFKICPNWVNYPYALWKCFTVFSTIMPSTPPVKEASRYLENWERLEKGAEVEIPLKFLLSENTKK